MRGCRWRKKEEFHVEGHVFICGKSDTSSKIRLGCIALSLLCCKAARDAERTSRIVPGGAETNSKIGI